MTTYPRSGHRYARFALLLALATAAYAPAASAGIIFNPTSVNLAPSDSSNPYHYQITNLAQTVTTAPVSDYYRQPVMQSNAVPGFGSAGTVTGLHFANMNSGANNYVAQIVGAGTQIVDITLSFDVTYVNSQPATVSVYESQGSYEMENGGSVSAISGSLSISRSPSSPYLASSSLITTGFSSPPAPFDTEAWTATATANLSDSSDPLGGNSNTFHVTYHSLLQVSGTNSSSFATINKKNLVFGFPIAIGSLPPPATPEPASLALLATGSLALLSRRRQR